MASISLQVIPTLSLLYKLGRLQPASSTFPNATAKYNDKISLIRTDLTTLETDSIVNAANESLLGGGGVDGAIHRAAGRALYEECATLGGCNTGSSKITDAYKLPCKKVIHAVGPIYSSRRPGESEALLKGCYTTSLDLAARNGLKSIAFSALSTGIYGYPSRDAAKAALGAVKAWLDADEERAAKLERIVFCSFLQKDEKAYEEFVPQYFPPDTNQLEENAGEGAPAEDKAKGEEDLPDLPSPPTKEPTEECQPEPKRVKLSVDSEPAKIASKPNGVDGLRESGTEIHQVEFGFRHDAVTASSEAEM